MGDVPGEPIRTTLRGVRGEEGKVGLGDPSWKDLDGAFWSDHS